MKKKTVHIIDSLIEMTGHRDRELIAVSLVKTLYQLLPTTKAALFEVQKDHDSILLKHLAHIDANGLSSRLDKTSEELKNQPDEAILQCINTLEEVSVTIGNDETQLILPIIDEKEVVVGLLIHNCMESLPEHQHMTRGLLQLYQNFRTLVDNSQRDPMTGLLNRETFVASLNKILTEASLKAASKKNRNSTRRQYNEEEFSYWLGLLDIDHFKRVNDSFGHLYGDEVILLVVSLMRATFREEDLLFRYGGEEFIVVIRVPSKDDADIAFERLRKAVETRNFGIAEQITISIGYVKVQDNDLPLSVVSKADKALYYAKEHGRNCLYDYDELVEAGELREKPGEETNGSDDFEGFDGFESF